VDAQRAEVLWRVRGLLGQDEHHLDTARLDDLAAGEWMRRILALVGDSVDLDTVATPDLEEPVWGLLPVRIVVYGGRLAREDLCGPKINVDVVFFAVGDGGLGGAADNDGRVPDIVRPVARRYLGIGRDVLRHGLVDGVGMILAGLDGLGLQVLGDLCDEAILLVVVVGDRLIDGDEAGALVFKGFRRGSLYLLLATLGRAGG
jgi:hypothetical protein